jgi:hypothetical protein
MMIPKFGLLAIFAYVVVAFNQGTPIGQGFDDPHDLREDQNLCRITYNNLCSYKGLYMKNCDDKIHKENPSFSGPNYKDKCPLGYTLGPDAQVCCNDENLNGGYCKHKSKLGRNRVCLEALLAS